MKIALIGYGKMGKAIETIALQQGHEIVLKIDADNQQDFTKVNLEKADVAIEFTSPHSAEENIRTCLAAGISVVAGSTGWTDHLASVQEYCRENNGSFLYSSNFSIGVNIFFEINKHLAAMMNAHAEYDVTIEEIHHTQKKDAPSGTAITIAEQIIQQLQRKKQWVNMPATKPEELEIISERVDPAPGTHTVLYSSEIDDIEITHTAHNRTGFATGAVLAAAYIHDKRGIFTMQDVLGL